jgi:hypothetical protein
MHADTENGDLAAHAGTCGFHFQTTLSVAPSE